MDTVGGLVDGVDLAVDLPTVDLPGVAKIELPGVQVTEGSASVTTPGVVVDAPLLPGVSLSGETTTVGLPRITTEESSSGGLPGISIETGHVDVSLPVAHVETGNSPLEIPTVTVGGGGIQASLPNVDIEPGALSPNALLPGVSLGSGSVEVQLPTAEVSGAIAGIAVPDVHLGGGEVSATTPPVHIDSDAGAGAGPGEIAIDPPAVNIGTPAPGANPAPVSPATPPQRETPQPPILVLIQEPQPPLVETPVTDSPGLPTAEGSPSNPVPVSPANPAAGNPQPGAPITPWGDETPTISNSPVARPAATTNPQSAQPLPSQTVPETPVALEPVSHNSGPVASPAPYRGFASLPNLLGGADIMGGAGPASGFVACLLAMAALAAMGRQMLLLAPALIRPGSCSYPPPIPPG